MGAVKNLKTVTDVARKMGGKSGEAE
jgi:hypothetical protein